MRNLRGLNLAAIALPIAMLVPAAYAQDLHERSRQAVMTTNDDLQKYVHRDNLTDDQRGRFDTAIREMREFSDDAAAGRWEHGREHLNVAIENIEFVADNASIGPHERDMLHEDTKHLREIRDGWR
jgi:hypothetical protein